MNKKGFTLVELLAVIVILSLILTLSFKSIFGVKDNADRKSLETKIKSIEKQAAIYGQDTSDIFEQKNDRTSCTEENRERADIVAGASCIVITVKILVEANYYETKDTDDSGKLDVKNDITKESMLENEIIIYRKNNRIYAIMAKDLLNG